MLEGQKSFIPLALQIIGRDKKEEGIYIVGPSTDIPITDKERAEVPALAAVKQNLASMFRYVPAVEEFVRMVLSPSLKAQKPYVVDTARYDDIRKGITTAAKTTLENIALTDPSGVIKKESMGKIPAIADPEVLVNYYIRKVFADFFEFKPGQNIQVSFSREVNGDIKWQLEAGDEETNKMCAGKFVELLGVSAFLGALEKLMPRSKGMDKKVVCKFTKHVSKITQGSAGKKDEGKTTDSFLRLDLKRAA